ncbi:hypothetical protein [Mycobacterium lepromatosis]|nr:hypothetical protein [Mycobacterium lepromatosis]
MGLPVIATVGDQQPYWVCTVWLVLLEVTVINTARCMENLINTASR